MVYALLLARKNNFQDNKWIKDKLLQVLNKEIKIKYKRYHYSSNSHKISHLSVRVQSGLNGKEQNSLNLQNKHFSKGGKLELQIFN